MKKQKTQLEYCPIIAGVNFLDQVRSLENLNEDKISKYSISNTFFTLYK